MNKNYFIYGGIVLMLLILVFSNRQRAINWRKTYSFTDKNPYGAFAFRQMVPDLFPDQLVSESNETLYEILEVDSTSNILVICDFANIDEESLNSLIQHVADGGTAFMSFEDASQQLLDTLELSVANYYDTHDYNYGVLKDTVDLTFSDSSSYSFFSGELQNYLDSIPNNATVILTNDLNKPVAVNIPYSDGQFVISTTPILFTNYFFMYQDNHVALEKLISQIPVNNLTWTQYYQVGRLESSTPFRVLLNYPSLRFALQFGLIVLLVFMVFSSRRIQRAIPIISRPPNQTLEFIKTVGLLYFNTQNHRAVAQNRLAYYVEFLQLKYNLNSSHDPKTISIKTGVELSLIEELNQWAMSIGSQNSVSPNQLFRLNTLLENFYEHTRN